MVHFISYGKVQAIQAPVTKQLRKYAEQTASILTSVSKVKKKQKKKSVCHVGSIIFETFFNKSDGGRHYFPKTPTESKEQ